jgi:predicted nucleic acid-binding protein
MKYLIDTDIASYYLRNRFNLLEIFGQKGPTNIRLSIITVAQLQVLAYKNPSSKINFSTIQELVRWVGVLELNRYTWEIFSLLKAETEKQGRPKGDLEVLQSSLAKQFKLVVVTHNTDHYKGLVEYEDWTREPVS